LTSQQIRRTGGIPPSARMRLCAGADAVQWANQARA
jgi:hypothetical protein